MKDSHNRVIMSLHFVIESELYALVTIFLNVINGRYKFQWFNRIQMTGLNDKIISDLYKKYLVLAVL